MKGWGAGLAQGLSMKVKSLGAGLAQSLSIKARGSAGPLAQRLLDLEARILGPDSNVQGLMPRIEALENAVGVASTGKPRAAPL